MNACLLVIVLIPDRMRLDLIIMAFINTYVEKSCALRGARWVKAANREDFGCELKFVAEFYGQDFNKDQLKLQLETLSANLPSSVHDLPSIIMHFKSFSKAQRSLLSQVCTLLSLILVMPATNAVSECSFSALRRISTFLRTTMTQNRLNSIMVLHVHKEHTDKINLIDVGNDFVGQSEHRMTQLGKFTPTDL